jgi:hypothetical protein
MLLPLEISNDLHVFDWNGDPNSDLHGIEIIKNAQGRPLAKIGAGTTNDQFREFCLENRKYCLPLNVIMVEVFTLFAHLLALTQKHSVDHLRRIKRTHLSWRRTHHNHSLRLGREHRICRCTRRHSGCQRPRTAKSSIRLFWSAWRRAIRYFKARRNGHGGHATYERSSYSRHPSATGLQDSRGASRGV